MSGLFLICSVLCSKHSTDSAISPVLQSLVFKTIQLFGGPQDRRPGNSLATTQAKGVCPLCVYSLDPLPIRKWVKQASVAILATSLRPPH